MPVLARLFRPWRWAALRTIRGRLISGLLVLLAVVCAVVGGASYYAVSNSLYRELDVRLGAATTLAYNCMNNMMDNGPDGDDHHGGDAHGGPVPPDPDGGQGSVYVPPNGTLNCPGLASDTFTAASWHGHWTTTLVPDGTCALSAADKRVLLGLPARRLESGPPAYTQMIGCAHSTFVLTATHDDDGIAYFTGLPVSSVTDPLGDLVRVELLIFAAVLATAGAGGALWVRLSLRPLRRVAATAFEVAQLPLESGEVELPAGVPDTDPATETGQVGVAFNRMLGHVQSALQRRAASEARLRRFAADASHELRTPLAAIRGYAELALRHRPGDSPEAVTHALNRMLAESTRMGVLVDDLLLLARLDAGRPLSREPVDVSRLAIDATSGARVARPDHRWVLELPDDPVQVLGDEHRLHQVLANLLSNAGRHTPAGTTVTVGVSADCDVTEDGDAPPGQTVRRGSVPPLPRTVLTVTDDGPGIPPNLLPDLFERFTRADTARSHASDANSTGLGMAIVDAVVAALGGAVVVTSRPGRTRFMIVLPRLAERAARASRVRKTLHRS